MTDQAFGDPAVAAVFDRHPPDLRAALMDLRALILAAAAETPRVGQVVETLKWGQPAYLPARPRVGTTVRIDALAGASGGYAMYFHCQTSLLATFRDIYPDDFTFEGDRALIFSTARPIPEEAVKHCVSLALGYHLRAVA
ncbi:DUF1801 domain-containing protein [Phenylobacterium sp.]|uniref:DUF1801 domain-containing protein n=1 Tax=Phenylobacterium sp. TaxID=1871053 RepID=UPI002733C8C1|nr:DUF1801 domain-containing protein [Phenylobacterium sp.]MDP3855703.1 DUF1801 domain-containing protein [Phenylobacterium sp.]